MLATTKPSCFPRRLVGGSAWHRGGLPRERQKFNKPGSLLGDEAQMASDAQPLSILSDPRVRKTTSVFVMLAFVRPLFVRCPGDDDGIAVAMKLHVFGNLYSQLIRGITDSSQELRLGKHGAVVIG